MTVTFSPLPGDFNLGLADCFRRFRTPVGRRRHGAPGDRFMQDSPGAIHVYAVVGNEPSGGCDSVSLSAKILRRRGDLRQNSAMGLEAVFGCDLGFGYCRKVLRIVLPCPFQSVLSNMREWRRRPDPEAAQVGSLGSRRSGRGAAVCAAACGVRMLNARIETVVSKRTERKAGP